MVSTPSSKDDDQALRAQVVEALHRFLRSAEGAAARELLAASTRHIILAEENEGDGYGVVFYLDGTGLHRSVEAMGTWMAYADSEDIPAPGIEPLTPEDAVGAVFTRHMTRVPPDRHGDLVGWLGEQLDAIARQAPLNNPPGEGELR